MRPAVRTLGLMALVLMGTTAVRAESMTEALASAYRNSPDIISAQVSAKAQAETIVRAKSGLLPNIGAGLGVSDNFSITPTQNSPGGPSNAAQASLSLTYSQTIFDNNRTAAAVEAARAATEAQQFSAIATEQSVLFAAAQAYVQVVQNTRIVALNQENVSFYRAQVQSASDRLDIGEGTRIDLAQAQSALAQANANYQSAVSNLQTAKANYVRYVGHQPSNLRLNFPYERLLPQTVAAAESLADSQHPAIRAALASVRAADANAQAAEAAFGPTVSLNGSLNGTNSLTSSSNSVGGQVSLQLSVPIYSGGALGASARQANLNQIGSELNARSTREQVRAQIASSVASLRSAAALIAAVQTAEDSSRLALNGVMEEQNVGQSTTLDVLNARNNLVNVQITRVNAEATRVLAAFTLLSSVGRLTADALNLPVVVRKPDEYRQKVEDIWQDLRAVPN